MSGNTTNNTTTKTPPASTEINEIRLPYSLPDLETDPWKNAQAKEHTVTEKSTIMIKAIWKTS